MYTARKTEEPAPEAAEVEDPEGEPPAGEAAVPKRGRRSKKEKAQEEARDLLDSQQVDLEVLEEFKARAAAEDEARKAAIGGGEDDPRRLNFHRSLLAASARGLTSECSRIIDSMIDAGLQPGARAIHVWAYSHIVVGDGRSARRVAEEAKTAFGVEWIPETYVALMHGALSCNGEAPDLMGALQVWVAQQDAAAAGRGSNPQLGFVFLAKELFRLRYSALAMQVVSEGYAAGFKPDDKLAALVIEQLCKQGLQAEAAAEMQRLLDAGLPVGPEQYDTLVRLEAARGSVEGARSMLQNFYTDPRFSPPRASTYNALLKGLASGLRLGPLGGAFPAAALAGDEGLGAEDEAGGAGGRQLELDGDSLDKLLVVLREEMVARGLRLGRETYAAMVESFAAVGDMDGALAAYDTLLRANGTPALLRKKYLGRLVVGLLVSDRPIDALRVLRDCSESSSFDDARENVTLPPSASAPLPGPAAGGRTALTVWLQAHYETMRQRRGQRASVLQFMQDADMSSRREVDGVVLGLGGCVVTADGLFVPPSKMTTAELRAELSGAGVELPASATGGSSSSNRSQLLKLVKDRRAKLPSGVIEMQGQLAAQLAVREEAERRAARKAALLAAREEAGDDDDLWGDEDEDEMEDDDDDDGPTGLDPNVASIIADEGTFEGGDSIEDSPTFFAAARGRLDATGEIQARDSLRVRGSAAAAAEAEAEAADEEELEDEYEFDEADELDELDDLDDDDLGLQLRDLDEGEDEEEEEDEEDGTADMLESVDMISGPGLDAAAVAAAKNKRRRKRRGDDDDEYDDEDDELAELGLDDDAPLSDGLGPIPGANRRGGELIQTQKIDDDEAILDQVLAMNTLDASRFNEAAGMVVALRMLGLWAAVGGVPTAADILALYEGAVEEGHPRCAADLAEQLPVLEAGGDVSTEQLTEMMVVLANICLSPAKADAEAADRVITAMEDAGLHVPPGLYSGLAAALGGRKRTRESVLGRSGHQVAAVEWEAAGNMANVTLDADVDDIRRGDEEGEGEAGAATASTDEAEQEAEEAEEGEAEEDEELFAGYEEDPAAQEAEELEWLFQRDAEEDDSWMDDLDVRPADVDEVRAEAEAKAAEARQEAAVTDALERVRLRAGPAAAALLAQRIEERGAERMAAAAQEAAGAVASEAAGADAGAAGDVDLLTSLETALAERGAITVLPEEGAAPQADAGGGAGVKGAEAAAEAELEDLAAEAEWQARSVLELPPGVLAEAASAVLAEMRAAGVVDDDDTAALHRIVDKATVLEQLRSVSTAAAAAHPGGIDAAAADVEAALTKLRAAEAAAMAYAAGAGLDAAAAGEDLGAAAREAAGWGEDEVLDFLDEIDETRGEMDEAEAAEMLTEEDLEPAVDDETGLTGVAAELAEEAVQQAEALLELEEAAGINVGDGDEAAEADGELLSEEERGYRASLVMGLEDAAAQREALERAFQEALKSGKKPKWGKEQKAVEAALDAGDVEALQGLVGLEGVEWIASELRALAEREEMELPADVDEAGEDELPVLPGGLTLSGRFMDAVRATMADRAAAAVAEGVPPAEALSDDLAVLDAVLALANGYRPQGFEGTSVSDLAGADADQQDGGDGSELDRMLQQLRRDASDALAAADAAVGTPAEEQAFGQASQVVSELLDVASEAYEEAEEAAAEVEEAMGEFEEGEEASPEEVEAGQEAARQFLAALEALRPTPGLPFGADGATEEEAEEDGGAATAVAAPPPAPAPPKAGRKGRGTRGTASSE
ncbi:hypothetical protein HXX76_000303 [Chlamydomonas incerta]|uniref:SAP domain-containing protein n=1 Tax=Chlamydomonas incerta TaxID=51695 RepID=A0A835WEB9_CHLIN|nr:hypothetical protein HXX76_000303 [Chlamydomonas incerta]|eukprot:KAG2445696.1 hypothetical protein HXX76_000303 [Chlamydomonas incerta]